MKKAVHLKTGSSFSFSIFFLMFKAIRKWKETPCITLNVYFPYYCHIPPPPPISSIAGTLKQHFHATEHFQHVQLKHQFAFHVLFFPCLVLTKAIWGGSKDCFQTAHLKISIMSQVSSLCSANIEEEVAPAPRNLQSKSKAGSNTS